ncbi:cytochrome c [Pontibacterium granulatum]|uniref:c-type cytochrome n=1 Tax=Pontibacterium granulatum TaxID=2036029 RepID=UPI00249B183C|nr:cytochrome c [Pontibacterium granulatum]MDI3323004.1 cytochrome c [Pontibacterium granulatum]
MRTIALLVACLSLAITGCEQKFDPARLKKGDELYEYYCIGCHTNRGLGPYLENLPITENSLKDYQIMLMIKYGYYDSHSMPTFDNLSAEQAEAVSSYTVQKRQEQRNAQE